MAAHSASSSGDVVFVAIVAARAAVVAPLDEEEGEVDVEVDVDDVDVGEEVGFEKKPASYFSMAALASFFARRCWWLMTSSRSWRWRVPRKREGAWVRVMR